MQLSHILLITVLCTQHATPLSDTAASYLTCHDNKGDCMYCTVRVTPVLSRYPQSSHVERLRSVRESRSAATARHLRFCYMLIGIRLSGASYCDGPFDTVSCDIKGNPGTMCHSSKLQLKDVHYVASSITKHWLLRAHQSTYRSSIRRFGRLLLVRKLVLHVLRRLHLLRRAWLGLCHRLHLARVALLHCLLLWYLLLWRRWHSLLLLHRRVRHRHWPIKRPRRQLAKSWIADARNQSRQITLALRANVRRSLALRRSKDNAKLGQYEWRELVSAVHFVLAQQLAGLNVVVLGDNDWRGLVKF